MGWGLIFHRLYMASPEWGAKKQAIRTSYERHHWPIACIRCGVNNRLQLHHNYYLKDIDAANLSDLDWICNECHDSWHRICPGYAQNNNTKLNFRFYAGGIQTASYITDLLRQKIDIDQQELQRYFGRQDVAHYEEAGARKNRILLWTSLISFALVFVYGIGIITFFVSFIVFRNPVPKPDKFDTYDDRRNALRLKNEILLGS